MTRAGMTRRFPLRATDVCFTNNSSFKFAIDVSESLAPHHARAPIMLHRRSTAALFLALLFAGLPSLGAAEAKAPLPVKKTEELTLEKLFPKKGLFGQPGHGMAFSFDGKY